MASRVGLYCPFCAVTPVSMRYTPHANAASIAKRKRLLDNSDKSFFISEYGLDFAFLIKIRINQR
jgi:hypothetical protein